MKTIILTTLYTFFIVGNIYAQKSDYELVSETASYYLDGGTNNDFETLTKAFDKTAAMKFIGDEYKEVNALEFFKIGMKPSSPQNRKTRIANIDISGHAANAKLEIV